MPVNRYATAAGKKFQRDVMKYLRDDRGLDAENLVLTGAEDEGDIILKYFPGYEHDKPAGNVGPDRQVRIILEAKREKGFHLADWVKQAEVERDNYAKHRYLRAEEVGFVVVHYRRQHGVPKAYITTTLDEWLRGQGL
jgi:hypothetical protein